MLLSADLSIGRFIDIFGNTIVEKEQKKEIHATVSCLPGESYVLIYRTKTSFSKTKSDFASCPFDILLSDAEYTLGVQLFFSL